VVELDERTLAFEVAGRLDSVQVHRGDPIKAGALVATLDASLARMARASRASEAEAAESQVALLKAGARPEDVRAMAAQVRAAKAGEDLLQKNLERETALAARGVTPRAVVDDLQAQLARAAAQRQALEHQLRAVQQGARREEIASASSRADALSTAADLENVRLDRFELKAGVDGTILDVHAEQGEVVGPGTPVATLGDVSHPYCDVFVPQGQIGKVKLGAPVKLHVDSIGKPFAGTVEYISRTTEFTPRFLFSDQERPNLVIRVRVRVDDPRRELHSGVPAFVELAGGGK
jgi:HlyD family secretion protein